MVPARNGAELCRCCLQPLGTATGKRRQEPPRAPGRGGSAAPGRGPRGCPRAETVAAALGLRAAAVAGPGAGPPARDAGAQSRACLRLGGTAPLASRRARTPPRRIPASAEREERERRETRRRARGPRGEPAPRPHRARSAPAAVRVRRACGARPRGALARGAWRGAWRRAAACPSRAARPGCTWARRGGGGTGGTGDTGAGLGSGPAGSSAGTAAGGRPGPRGALGPLPRAVSRPATRGAAAPGSGAGGAVPCRCPPGALPLVRPQRERPRTARPRTRSAAPRSGPARPGGHPGGAALGSWGSGSRGSGGSARADRRPRARGPGRGAERGRGPGGSLGETSGSSVFAVRCVYCALPARQRRGRGARSGAGPPRGPRDRASRC